MSRTTLILILVVGLLAALSSWLSREKEEVGQSTERPLPHIPDYYISDFSAAAYSAMGSVRDRLSAESMTHYADDSTSRLVHPQLTFFAENGETWQLEAGRGDADATGDTVQLADSVTIRRANATEGVFTLATQQLTVHTREQFATTRTPVTITAPGTRIEAAGLDAHFADGKMVLFSVRGRYEQKP